MGVTLFYTGGKPHTLSDRLKDMKHMVFQQEEYDLSTDEGKENTWHGVNAMLLGAAAVVFGNWIGNKIFAPIEQKRKDELLKKAYMYGQIDAYKYAFNKQPKEQIKR